MPTELENQADEATDTLVVEPVLDDAAASQEVDVAKAESSTAEDASKTAEPDALSIVRDVVGKKSDDPAAASSAEGEESDQKKGSATPKEPDNENFSDVPFHKHKRFQELLEAKKSFETDAQRYRNVQTFIDEQGITAEEAADLLVIGGLIKTNPAAAWERMKPVVQKVLAAAGEVLPDELKQMVASGEMTREAALEVSRSRARLQSVEARTQFDQQRAQQRAQVDAVNAIQTTVSSWEADRKLRDPNFDAKMPAIEREVAWLMTKEGRPNSPEGVKAQLQKAYDTVSAAFKPPVAIRQKPAIVPVVGGQKTGNVRPEIETTQDVIKDVLARRRAG